MLARFSTLALAALWAACATPSQAQIRLASTLTATQACPATTAIRGGGTGISIQPGQQYPVVAKNRADATHVLLLIDGQRRWVDVRCGLLGNTDSTAAAATGAAAPPLAGDRATYVLAMSWEPAFCRGHGDRPECARTEPGAAGRQLSLHGLWPQPRGRAYCGVDRSLVAADRAHHWESLPEPDIAPRTRARLAAQMPGLASGLERHEWVVHGTCSGLSADAYFARAADLAEQVNATGLPAYFAANEGRTLDAAAIRAAFDQAFGPGAGARVLISCPGRSIQEFDLNLAGAVTAPGPLAPLLAAANPVQPGCPRGQITSP